MTAENDHIRIEALIRRWAKGIREGNRTALRADHDAAVLMFDLAPPCQTSGLDACMATWEAFLGGWRELLAFDFHDLQITNGLDVAFATAIGRCEGLAAEGAKHSLEFRLTMGLRKVDARWRVTHEHLSLPAVWIGKRIPTVGVGSDGTCAGLP